MRIVRDGDVRQDVTVTREIVGLGIHLACLVAAAPNISIFKMRRRDLQRVSNPLTVERPVQVSGVPQKDSTDVSARMRPASLDGIPR
jgi:hypothetical protein